MTQTRRLHAVRTLVVAGPSIRSGASLDRPHVYDVAPTALRLLDLPIADDMIGRVWSEALDSPAPAPPTVPTYPYRPPPIPPLRSELRDRPGLGERLEALGYTG